MLLRNLNIAFAHWNIWFLLWMLGDNLVDNGQSVQNTSYESHLGKYRKLGTKLAVIK
jgi:hypothetical protein